MGMYTEFVCSLEISKEIPDNVKNILEYMTNPDKELESKLELP